MGGDVVGGHGEDGEGSECTPTDHTWWAWPPRGHAHNTQHSPTAALTTQQWVGLRVGHAQWVWPHTANGCPRQHPAGGASVLAPPSGRAHPQPIGPPQCPEGGASDWLLPLGVATLPMSLKNTQWAEPHLGPSQWAWPHNQCPLTPPSGRGFELVPPSGRGQTTNGPPTMHSGRGFTLAPPSGCGHTTKTP